MKTAMIILGASLLFCVMLPGCKEKSEEEEIEQLVEKMGEAKTVEEAATIADKLEKLEERAKKNAREVSVKLGQPFTFWQLTDSASGDMTQFSMIFENVAVTDEDIVGHKEEKKKCFMILARVMNQGPRKSWRSPSGEDIQVKTDKGYLYRTSGYPALEFFSSEPPFPLDWKTLDKWHSPFGVLGKSVDIFKETLEPEEIGWIIYHTWIPEDNTPIEVFAQFPTEAGSFGGKKRTNFRLKLTQSGGDTGEIERKSTSLDRKFPKESIAGEYTMIEGAEKMPGTYIFKKDGTTAFSQPGSDVKLLTMRWNIENGIMQIYDGGEKFEGKIENNTIIVESKRGQIRFLKQDDKGSNIENPINRLNYLQFPLKGDWKPIMGFNVWSEDWCGRHLGEDIKRKPEIAVFPMTNGLVKFAKYQPEIGIGYGVIVEHNFKGEYLCSVYYHMREPKTKEALREGQTVTPDQSIGYISGEQKDHLSIPHLHFGIRKGKYRLGRDLRTNRWYYPGYTAIYNEQNTKQSNPDNPAHNEIVKEWHKPSEFINANLATLPPKAESEPKARVTTTMANLKILHIAVNQFKMDTGRFPSEEEGLKALIEQPSDVKNWEPGGYLETRQIPKDIWGNDFIYELYPESGKPFVIKSLGADGEEGGEGYDADLLSTEAYTEKKPTETLGIPSGISSAPVSSEDVVPEK